MLARLGLCLALLENGGRGDACEVGSLLVVVIWWWCRVWSKITTAKEQRLSEDHSPSKSHIFPLYNGIGLTTHELTEISHLGTFMV